MEKIDLRTGKWVKKTFIPSYETKQKNKGRIIPDLQKDVDRLMMAYIQARDLN